MNIYMVLFLTIGLGSTLVSRMVINLRSWNRTPDYPELAPDHNHSKRHVGSGDISNMFELATRRTTAVGSQTRSRSRGDPYDVDYDDEIDKSANLHSRSVHIDIGGRPTYRRQGSLGPLQVQKRNSLLQHQQRNAVGVVVEREIVTSADSVHFEDAVPLPVRTGGRGRAFQARTGAGRDRDIEMFDDDSSLDGEDGDVDHRDGKKRPLDSLKDFFGPNGPQPPN